jgi:enoyl-CoA hydratase/carnithine racemase
MSFKTISLQQNGAVLRATLSNPPVNTMSAQMVGELFQLAGRLQMDPSVKVVVLDSADPDFFIAHFDLNDLEASAKQPSKTPDLNALQSLALTWQILPQVTLAKVTGRCRGGGLEFIMGLNMRFATLDAKFCFPEASAGFLASGGGATRTALAAGPARALEVLLSSRDFSGEEAERYGLINRALPAAELDAYVEDLVVRVARRSLEVVAMHREVFRKVYQGAVEPMFAGLAAENAGLRAALKTEEMMAGVVGMLSNGGQTRERELDLPATIASMQPFVK